MSQKHRSANEAHVGNIIYAVILTLSFNRNAALLLHFLNTTLSEKLASKRSTYVDVSMTRIR